MSDNPMLDVAQAANRISSGALERIGKIQQNTIDNRLKRQQLEEKVMYDDARLRIQSSNYEANIEAKANTLAAQTNYQNETIAARNRTLEANAMILHAKELSKQIPALETDIMLEKINRRDTSALEARLEQLKAQSEDITNKAASIYNGTYQPEVYVAPDRQTSIPYPAPRQQGEIGFEARAGQPSNVVNSSVQFYGPQGAVQQPAVRVKGFNLNDEDKDAYIRMVAAEVESESDDDGMTMKAETIRNRMLNSGGSMGDTLNSRYYPVSMDGGSKSRFNNVSPEAYKRAEAAVNRAIAGSDLSDSAMHNYYKDEFDAATRDGNDFASGIEHQKEVYYRKNLSTEANFNIKNYLEPIPQGEQQQEGEPELLGERMNLQTPAGWQSGRSAESLFPPSLRPDGGASDIPVAQPLLEQEPEVAVANEIDFFDSSQGVAEVSFAPANDGQVIINDGGLKKTGGIRFNDRMTNGEIAVQQAEPKFTEQKENPVTYEIARALATRIASMTPDEKKVQGDRIVQTIVTQNPAVWDEELTQMAEDSAAQDASDSEFRQRIPPYVTDTVGDKRATDIYSNIMRKKTAEKNEARLIKEEGDTLENLSKMREGYHLNYLDEIAKEDKMSAGKRDYFLQRVNEVDAQIEGIISKRAKPTTEGQTTEQLNVKSPEETATEQARIDNINAAMGLAPRTVEGQTPTAPTSTPSPEGQDNSAFRTMNEQMQMKFEEYGIEPKFMPKVNIERGNDYAWFKKLKLNLGFDGALGLVNDAKLGYILTEGNKIRKKDTRNEIYGNALSYLNNNRTAVISYASKIKGLDLIDPETGEAVSIYDKLEGAGDLNMMEGSLGVDGEFNSKAYLLLAKNPDVLYGVIQAMGNSRLEVIKDDMIQLVDAVDREERKRVLGALGIPEDK